jgi:hypothetical protein
MNMTAAYSFIGIISVILGLAKEIITIVLLVKGIQVANVYIKKNKEEKVKDLSQDKTETPLEDNGEEKMKTELQNKTDEQVEDNEKDK